MLPTATTNKKVDLELPAGAMPGDKITFTIQLPGQATTFSAVVPQPVQQAEVLVGRPFGGDQCRQQRQQRHQAGAQGGESQIGPPAASRQNLEWPAPLGQQQQGQAQQGGKQAQQRGVGHARTLLRTSSCC